MPNENDYMNKPGMPQGSSSDTGTRGTTEGRQPESREDLSRQPLHQTQEQRWNTTDSPTGSVQPTTNENEGRPLEGENRTGARGTAAMDPSTRQEVARKGGIAVSRNRQHMAEIGRKGGQRVSQNREHMAKIGRKGGAASRGGR